MGCVDVRIRPSNLFDVGWCVLDFAKGFLEFWVYLELSILRTATYAGTLIIILFRVTQQHHQTEIITFHNRLCLLRRFEETVYFLCPDVFIGYKNVYFMHLFWFESHDRYVYRVNFSSKSKFILFIILYIKIKKKIRNFVFV